MSVTKYVCTLIISYIWFLRSIALTEFCSTTIQKNYLTHKRTAQYHSKEIITYYHTNYYRIYPRYYQLSTIDYLLSTICYSTVLTTCAINYGSVWLALLALYWTLQAPGTRCRGYVSIYYLLSLVASPISPTWNYCTHIWWSEFWILSESYRFFIKG